MKSHEFPLDPANSRKYQINHLSILDEPFGALDAMTKQQLQHRLADIRRHTTLTILLVTHDVEEAVFLADRVVVMSPRPGRISTLLPISLPYPRDRTSHTLLSQRQALGEALQHSEAPATV